MKAVVFHGVGDIRLEDVPEPKIEAPTDAIVRITASAICGTDLHMVRGTLPGMAPGTILGHEGVGVVEELGPDVRNLSVGDRVIIPSTISCGNCSYCRAGYTSQCDVVNPNGPQAGTAYYGGPQKSGPFHGLQAEKARVPFANVNLVRIPDGMDDDEALLLSDIFPTSWMAAELAEIGDGDTVAVFGCGPVGQLAIASAKLMGAGRVFAVDCLPDRLDRARAQGAEVVDFSKEDPVEQIRRLTGGIGVDRAIDAVGVDAMQAPGGPAEPGDEEKAQFEQELKEIAPEVNPSGENWVPGDAPSQAIEWAVQALAKAGTLSIIGVYPPSDRFFPLGLAMGKNLTINAGNCNHRKYIPHLIELVETGVISPAEILSQRKPFTDVLDAYRAFDKREPAWLKVGLYPEGAGEARH
ncbi:MAG TPA: zinc-dependent alcohol dehydrogenase [Vulgatibacter sp.]|nr:zinc-dependent alcohol dehydrogenase [Vulgatibacter sp.]